MKNNLQYKNRKLSGVTGIIAVILLMAFSMAGCAYIISQETMKEVDRGITFEQLIKDRIIKADIVIFVMILRFNLNILFIFMEC